MKNIVISGYYGQLNTGDEAILRVLIDKLREYEREENEDLNIVVLSSRPELTSKLYNVDSVNRKKIWRVVKSIKKCDIFISGGGSLFQNETSNRSLYYYLFQIFVAKLFGKKVFIFSQGIGPIKKWYNILIFKHIIKLADYITVRDYDSFDLLHRLKLKKRVDLSADPAFLLNPCCEKRVEKLLEKYNIDFNKKTIGIVVRKWKKEKDMADKIAQIADILIENEGYNVVFIPFQGKWDIIKINEIISKMKNKPYILSENFQPHELLGVFRNFDLIVGMRLHSLIFAAIMNTRFIGISYDPKIDSFLKMYGLKPAGYVDSFDINNVLINIQYMLSETKMLKKIEQTTQNMVQKAEKSFEILKEALNSIKKKKSINVLDVRVDCVNFYKAKEKCIEFLATSSPHIVFTPNVEMIMLSQKDEKFKKVLNSSDLNIPDGIGVVWASKYFGEKLFERVTGFDMMMSLMPELEKKGCRVFLLGAKPGIAEKAKENLLKQFKNLEICGVYHGYFSEEENDTVVEIINSSKADVLFVAMGMKKQEEWIYKNKKKLKCKLIMGVGGSLDVLSGEVKRAPVMFQRLGLEWFYRLITQPWRFKRMLALPKFVLVVLKTRIFGGR
ncbi:polysaccharide pyruvyl transferase CsaB [Caldicellulosiruptor hydrothermalis 108]|uniref:N-acetylglucosaminyldiphosphoundecaprenol N-acetyl-beta-D-mannosaminyltransferase n=1 Tax=Caldicellulosiruptor hydrothermalis (strain DSM 18901 / VKM B-2411 / 108) TaxID=632292 RepID=E4QDL4_CALH1|nr:polysaccharide pyruvyl transferase CsaB [Caldicellulosiruptor hydrothermalis]ADQ06431.1 polysaccharide pyruvyl transferase CsaB [Caldicellulosiruptor hydrothermalis 108]